jgi:hypothetical protein
MKAPQQFLASLNASVERANSERTRVFDPTRPIRIPGLDSEAHEILWKHQAQLVKLNADLNAERIQQAIVDNPQHLESAILAFIENSATGAKTLWRRRVFCLMLCVRVGSPAGSQIAALVLKCRSIHRRLLCLKSISRPHFLSWWSANA